MMKSFYRSARVAGVFFLLGACAISFTSIVHAQSDPVCNPACGSDQDCVLVSTTGTATECVSSTPVCNPACATGQYCVYVGSAGSQTGCIANNYGTAGNPIVVTAPTATTTAAAPTPAATGSTFATLANNLVSLLNGSLVPLLYALAFLYFVAGVARYIFIEGLESRQKARNMIIYGLIGLVVIFGIWGILNLLIHTLQFA